MAEKCIFVPEDYGCSKHIGYYRKLYVIMGVGAGTNPFDSGLTGPVKGIKAPELASILLIIEKGVYHGKASQGPGSEGCNAPLAG